MKILILDDDKDILEILTVILSEAGYETCCLTKGNRIIEVINEFKPKLILMDVMLGAMNGMDICNNIKENELYSHLPVILISATPDMDKSLNIQGAPDDFLEKPFDIDILLSMVEKHLNLV